MSDQPPSRARGLESLAVHAGQAFDPTTGAVIPPVHFSTTFVQDGINVLRAGHEYSRGSNPTRNGFETQLAALEHGDDRVGRPEVDTDCTSHSSSILQSGSGFPV